MIAKNRNTIVLMPPKTASNSIRGLLEQSGFIFSRDSKNPNFPQIHLKLSEIAELYDIDDLEKYKIIQIVRNPYYRYVSSFFFQKKIIPRNYTPKFINYDLEEFSNHLLESKKTTDFVRSFYGDTLFVESLIRNGISWGGSRLYDTQLSWNNLKLNVNYFKLEDLTNSVECLLDHIELKSDVLPNINSQNLTFDYMSLITPNVKKIIIELFDEDFESFGYKK
jgi:hypothetical protein